MELHSVSDKGADQDAKEAGGEDYDKCFVEVEEGDSYSCDSDGA